MNMNVLLSVFKRDFVSYFTSPLGYVFVWLFVFLGTIAAFWSNEFFNANLANLDQLNFWFPFIMLAFIPAITMSVWAEERRQGTDELLLTIPVADFDIVLGKYLAAVTIFTVSLLFSLLCNYLVLETLGNPDVGLLAGTYCGYWFVGLAMLAVGMVGSFMTRNLTVAFILGALFNAPLVLAVWADSIMAPAWGLAVRPWSVGQQFADFGSGVISLSSIVYFVTVLAVMLYVCMVMIGRRHWARGADWGMQAVHFAIRTAALIAIAVCVILLFGWHDVRLDVTSERINSLSPRTVDLIRSVEAERPVQIEAFISPRVPEAYVQTKANLESVLREFQGLAGAKMRVRIHSAEPYSKEASYAEKLYEIQPRPVPDLSRGTVTTERIFLGVAITHGLERVVLPFIDRGIPVEYELARSVAIVTDQKRKKIGVVDTDAPLFGQFNMQAMTPGQDWPIIAELQKQYEVVRIDPNQPITEEVDALLAVQPSSLAPEAMEHFIAAIESGIPTAIFEDPFPVLAGNVPATSMPRSSPQMNPMMGMMGQQQQAPPKGDIGRLWRLLGVDFAPDQVVWQNYNPYRKARTFPNEFVFVDGGADVDTPFNTESRISSDLQQVLFPFPGALSKLQVSELEFKPLAKTGNKTGSVRFNDLVNMGMFGRPSGLNENPRRVPTGNNYVLAARIRGKLKPAEHMADDPPASTPSPESSAPEPAASESAPAETPPAAEPTAGPAEGMDPPEAADAPAADAPAADAAKVDSPAAQTPASEPSATDAPATDAPTADAPAADTSKTDASAADVPATDAPIKKARHGEIDVVIVADLDMLTQPFFQIREEGQRPELGFYFDFDNVTFVLNALDSLAGDDRFVDIRSRRPKYRTLNKIEERTEEARDETAKARERLREDFEKARATEQEKLDREIERLRERMKKEKLGPVEVATRLQTVLNDGQRRLDIELEKRQRTMDSEVNEIETNLALEVRRVQDAYKFWAVALPPIPPLLLAVVVFFTRRMKEREGVAKTRLR